MRDMEIERPVREEAAIGLEGRGDDGGKLRQVGARGKADDVVRWCRS
jgi:hypothetical protein